jgi:hypothetical protein
MSKKELKRILKQKYMAFYEFIREIVRIRAAMKSAIKYQKKNSLLLMGQSVSQPVYVFSEMVGCGKIAKVALQSFIIHHPETVLHLYGVPDDFKWAPLHDKFVFHDLTPFPEILSAFKSGHLGTATLWAKIIKESSSKYLIHFDSDVIFRAPVINQLSKILDGGYDLVGPMRNYKNNPHGIRGIRHLPDITQTLCFGFNREKITDWNIDTLIKMCQGTYCPFGHNVIDFFDPISFDIIDNGGKVFILDVDDYGGFDHLGGRKNKYFNENSLIDFGDKLAHFSAVGSGMFYYHNKNSLNPNVPQSYINYALEKYSVFCKIFYDEDIGIAFDQKKYSPLFKIDNWNGTN